MVFPADPIDVTVQLWIDGAWVDAVDTGNGVRVQEPIAISGGQADWSDTPETGIARWRMDNRDGRWSPDNPTGPYLGQYRRNIPARVGVGLDTNSMTPTGVGADLASTPDVLGTGGGTPSTPTVSSTTSNESTYVVTHDFDLPATLAAGDRMLMVATLGHTSGAPAVGQMTGWTLVETTSMYTYHRCTVYEILVADSAQATALAGTTVQWTTSTGVRSTCHVFRVQGARTGGRGSAYAATAFTAQAVSSAPNTPSLTVPWGADQNLFLSIFSADATGITLSANPSTYTAVAYDGPQYVNGCARKSVTTATDDPGAFTLSAAANHTGLTVAYRPVEDSSTNGILDILADIDQAIEIELQSDLGDATLGAVKGRLAHKSSGANGWEWELRGENGRLVSAFTWYDSSAVQHTYTTSDTGSAIPARFNTSPFALRLDLDASTGNLDWFYGDSAATGPWTQIGATCTGVGPTSIKGNDAPVRVGGNPFDQNHIPFPGKIRAYRLRDSSDTVVCDPDFYAQAVGQSVFNDAAGRTWTIGAGGMISNTIWRFHGELSSIPVRWNVDGSDVWAPVEAAGLFRRLRQGNRRLDSPIHRAILRGAGSVVQYWPMEETGSTVARFGAAIGTAAVIVTGGFPNTATNTDFISSKALPTPGETVWTVNPDTYSATGSWQVRWLQSIPEGATGTDNHYFVVKTTDMEWHVRWRETGGGDLEIIAYRPDPFVVYQSGWTQFFSTGKAWRMSLAVTQVGGGFVSVRLDAQDPNTGAAGGIYNASAVAGSAGVVTEIKFNKDANVQDFALGHLALQSAVTPIAELATELNAYVGEPAATRVARLCREEGIATRIEGNPALSEVMGAQQSNTLMALLQECADTDLGILSECRTCVAVAYRTRESMLDQDPVIELDYTAGEVAASPELDRDDQNLVNDVEVVNWTGVIARAELNDGSPLSVSEPSDGGAGRYDRSYRVSSSDAKLPELAATRLALTTVDEPRVSRLALALQTPALAADPVLTRTILNASFGDLITVDNNLGVALGATQVRQLLRGTSDRIEPYRYGIDALTSPASPWESGGGIDPPDPEPGTHTVKFRSQQTLATPGTPAHVLTALGHSSTTPITRAQLDGILDAWVASTGGTTRNVTSAATWTTAMAAAVPGDLIRTTTDFSTAAQLSARGNLYSLAGSTLTASPAGGSEGLPIIVTSANGTAVAGTSLTSNVPVLDLVNCRHVWAVGFNADGPMQFGIRAMNWGGTAGFPAYIAYCTVDSIRDASIAVQGWFQDITTSGGTPPSGDGNHRGFSEWAVIESNTCIDPNPGEVSGNPGEGIYLGAGVAPGWHSYAKDCWVRGNLVTNYKANGYECKPGVRRARFTDNVAVAGRGSNGAPFELCYQFSGLATRPAYMNDIDGSGNGDIQIWCEGNRVYDYNITETGQTRNAVFIIGMAGVRVANNLLWSARDSAGNFGTGDNMFAVLIQSEKNVSDFGDTATQPTWYVNNNFQSRGVTNLGAADGALTGITARNNIVPTGYDGGQFTAGSADFIATTPAVGTLAAAEWVTYGPGSAFDLALTSTLIGAGTSISDLGLYIAADISQRPIPASAPNPGPFQPFT